MFLLKYGICYKTTTNKDGIPQIEKHIMRYPQLFATLAIRDRLREGLRKGVIWHTQEVVRLHLPIQMCVS